MIRSGTDRSKKADRMISRQIRAVFSNQAISMLLILIAMWLVLSMLSRYFFTVGNISEITLQTAVIGILRRKPPIRDMSCS